MGYPVFLNLKGIRVVIIGGGRIAERKLRSVIQEDANIVLVASKISDSIKALSSVSSFTLIEEKFETCHLEKATLVFAASSDQAVNEQVTDLCKVKGIMVNNCMDSRDSTFRSGATIKRGEVEIAIGTGGKRPGLSKWLGSIIETALPSDLNTLIDDYDTIRNEARNKFENSKDREQYIIEAFENICENIGRKK